MIIRVLPLGRDAGGLTRYLFGPGKANEHTNQRLVAGSVELHAEWGGAPLTMTEATQLGRMVEMSWRRQHAPELALAGQGAGGVSRANLRRGDDAVPGQDHVFHAALSLHPDDAPLTDEQWAEVAKKYVEGMGFVRQADYAADEQPDPGDVSWFAVHHGVSKEGNDHIHVVVCTTRRDGSTVDLSNTGRRSQVVRRERIETLEYVNPLHDANRPEHAPTIKGYTAAEHNIARDRAELGTGSAIPDRVQLQRIVRAAAEQSTTEVGFINAVLSHPGVQLEAARWEPGSKEKATGYKVSLNGGAAFSASKLASDLTLSKLRAGWSETPETDRLARELWNGDATKLDPLTATRDVPDQLDQAAAHLERFNDRLSTLDPHDSGAWSNALAGLAGTTTVLATGRPEAFRLDGGRAADVLARQALADEWARTDAPEVPAALTGAEQATRNIQLALRAGGTSKHRGWLAVVQQLSRAVAAIRDAKEARGELHAAHVLSRDAGTAMQRLEDYLSGTVMPAAQDSSPSATSGERTSERLLREQLERQRSGATPDAASPESEASELAQRVAAHARPDPDTQPGATVPAVPASVPTMPGSERGPGRRR